MVQRRSLKDAKQPGPMPDPEELLLTARGIPLPAWQALMGDPVFGRDAACLLWQSDGRRFSVSRGGTCRGADGRVIQPFAAFVIANVSESGFESPPFQR